MSCPGSGTEIWVSPYDDGEVVCPECSTLFATDMDSGPVMVPEHEEPFSQPDCPPGALCELCSVADCVLREIPF